MKILLFSVAPWNPTGYGKCCRYLVEGLSEHFDIDVLSYFGLRGNSLTFANTKVYELPGNVGNCADWVKRYFEISGADVVLQHFDSFILPHRWIEKSGLPVVTYTPVDCEPAPPETLNNISCSVANVAMSPHVDIKLTQKEFPAVYIPHFYDEAIFRPRDKKKCRQFFGVPEDKFFFGSVATNMGGRKNIINQLLAYRKFLDANPVAWETTAFYLHAYLHIDDKNPNGYNLLNYITELGISKNICYTQNYEYWIGMTESQMCMLMNTFDVLMSCSLGEGFGIPIIEAQACGVPTIATKFSAMEFTVGSGGLLVDIGAFVPSRMITAWHAVPSIDGMVQAMSDIWRDNRLKRELSDLAIKNAAKYQKKKIMPKWVELFKGLEADGVI